MASVSPNALPWTGGTITGVAQYLKAKVPPVLHHIYHTASIILVISTPPLQPRCVQTAHESKQAPQPGGSDTACPKSRHFMKKIHNIQLSWAPQKARTPSGSKLQPKYRAGVCLLGVVLTLLIVQQYYANLWWSGGLSKHRFTYILPKANCSSRVTS